MSPALNTVRLSLSLMLAPVDLDSLSTSSTDIYDPVTQSTMKLLDDEQGTGNEDGVFLAGPEGNYGRAPTGSIISRLTEPGRKWLSFARESLSRSLSAPGSSSPRASAQGQGHADQGSEDAKRQTIRT